MAHIDPVRIEAPAYRATAITRTDQYMIDAEAFSDHLDQRGFTATGLPMHITLSEGVGLRPNILGNTVRMLGGVPLTVGDTGYGETKELNGRIHVEVIAYDAKQATKTLIRNIDYAWNLRMLQGLVEYNAEKPERDAYTMKYIGGLSAAAIMGALMHPAVGGVILGGGMAYATYDHNRNPHHRTAQQAVRRYFDPDNLLIKKV